MKRKQWGAGRCKVQQNNHRGEKNGEKQRWKRMEKQIWMKLVTQGPGTQNLWFKHHFMRCKIQHLPKLWGRDWALTCTGGQGVARWRKCIFSGPKWHKFALIVTLINVIAVEGGISLRNIKALQFFLLGSTESTQRTPEVFTESSSEIPTFPSFPPKPQDVERILEILT